MLRAAVVDIFRRMGCCHRVGEWGSVVLDKGCRGTLAQVGDMGRAKVLPGEGVNWLAGAAYY